MKKIKEKYKDQDEEEREIRMKLLQVKSGVYIAQNDMVVWGRGRRVCLFREK